MFKLSCVIKFYVFYLFSPKCTCKEDNNKRGDDRNKSDNFKRIIYSKEGSYSSKDEDCDDSNDEALFMDVKVDDKVSKVGKCKESSTL